MTPTLAGALWRAVACALVVSVLVAPALASSWEGPAAATVKSVAVIAAPVQNPFTGEQVWQNVCTAFSIDEQRQLFLTAAHCLVAKDLTLDGHIAWVVYVNEDVDLAVLQCLGVRKPAIVPGVALKAGAAAAGVGHAYGYNKPILRAGHIAHEGLVIPETGNPVQQWVVVDTAWIGGMSGGPIIDEQGRLIAIVQMANNVVGLGVSIDVIREHTRAFWPVDVFESELQSGGC